MGNIFFISDTHWGSKCYTSFKCIQCKFRKHCARPLCPGDFEDHKDIHEFFVGQWNMMVNPKDTVYHLGDIANNHNYLGLLDKCNGIKHLILGNHDTYFRQYPQYFNKIRGSFVLKNEFFLSHVPIARETFTYYRSTTNIHGHIHDVALKPSSFRVNTKEGKKECQYISVVAGEHDFMPIPLDRIRDYVTKYDKEEHF